MTGMQPETIRGKLETAYQILAPDDASIGRRVDRIIGAWSPDPTAGRVPARYRDASAERTDKELRALLRAAERRDADAVASLIPDLHQTAITALSDAGCFILGEDRGNLDRIAACAANAVVAPSVADMGPPPNVRADVIGRILKRDFEELTGRKASYSGPMFDYEKQQATGPLLDFVTSVFGALDIKASAHAVAQELIYGKKKTKT